MYDEDEWSVPAPGEVCWAIGKLRLVEELPGNR